MNHCSEPLILPPVSTIVTSTSKSTTMTATKKTSTLKTKFVLFELIVHFITGIVKAKRTIWKCIPKLRNILLALMGALVFVMVGFLYTLDPDRGRNTCEIIIARGFPCETHSVTTYQSYIIDLHRIPNPGGPAVLLQTGLIGTSADFIMASSSVSKNPEILGHNMGLELAKQGYDVWLSNNRGGRYGKRHANMSNSEEAFWKFSFDQISQFDIPAIIDFVLKETKKEKLHYIGHSQGSAVMFALLSETDKYNHKLASFTAISPITRIGDASTSFRLVTTALKPLLFSDREIFGHNFLFDSFMLFASEFPLAKDICEFIFFSIVGPDYGQLDVSRLGVYTAHMPTSTSAQNVLHFDQLFTTNRFQKFDHGLVRNLHAYGSPSPPVYDLTSISFPSIYVIYSDNDWFVPLSGINQLRVDLNSTAKEFYLISNPNTNHMDPLIGKDVAIEVNRKVLDILKKK